MSRVAKKLSNIKINKKKSGIYTALLLAFITFLFFSYSVIPLGFEVNYLRDSNARNNSNAILALDDPSKKERKPEIVSYVETPENVKAIYMTNWVAGTKSLREPLIKLIDETELNAVVIDIKDYTGRIGFKPIDQKLADVGSWEERIADLDKLINDLHQKNIYVIGRVSVFQDSFMVDKRPDLAVKKASDKSKPWSDFKGVKWLDAGNTEVWEYVRDIAIEARNRGFDEINFDYIRFPSDGNMKDIYFPKSDGRTKAEVLESFFAYISSELKKSGTPTSADLFGMVTTNNDDMNIGQVLERALPYFDYIAPMVYPSHYPPNWNGLKNPAEHPYEVINLAMKGAIVKAEAIGQSSSKFRPWFQDFNLGATYDSSKIRAQIKAANELGIGSWMMWNASNRYTESAYLTE